MNSIFAKILKKTLLCSVKAASVFKELHEKHPEGPLIAKYHERDPEYFCGRITLAGDAQKIVSISIPPDATGNHCGEYGNPPFPETIEILMISDHDDLDRDIWRCTTVDELIAMLIRIRDGTVGEYSDSDEE